MSIIFYDCKTAPSPRRARILLALKNVPHETVEIDLFSGEQLGEAYRAINPGCTVPALKLEDGSVLTDNAGITAYLEATYPEPSLLGIGAAAKAEIASWISRLEMGYMMATAHAFRNSNPAMKGRALPGPDDIEQIPELAKRGMAQMDSFLDNLEKHMEGRDFIAADQLSAADVTAVCGLDFSKIVGKDAGEGRPNIARWRSGLAERASFNL